MWTTCSEVATKFTENVGCVIAIKSVHCELEVGVFKLLFESRLKTSKKQAARKSDVTLLARRARLTACHTRVSWLTGQRLAMCKRDIVTATVTATGIWALQNSETAAMLNSLIYPCLLSVVSTVILLIFLALNTAYALNTGCNCRGESRADEQFYIWNIRLLSHRTSVRHLRIPGSRN